MKWKNTYGVLCVRKIPLKIWNWKETSIGQLLPTMLYGSKYCAIKKKHMQKISEAKMRMVSKWLNT